MKRNKNILGFLLVAVILATSFGMVMWAHHPTDAAPKQISTTGTIRSQFSFGGAAGWWQGATNKTSMALFQDSHDCFTSAEYHAGTIDVVAAQGEYHATLVKAGYVVTSGAVQTLELQTNAGKQPYQLQQYLVSNTGNATEVEGGQEIGYLPLTGGYVKIIGDCNSASELSATLQALQAIRFNSVN